MTAGTNSAQAAGRLGSGLYTFSIEGDDLTTEQVQERFLENDDMAVKVAARLLGPGHVAVSVGRGEGDDVEWLGAWDWCEGQPRWSPEE